MKKDVAKYVQACLTCQRVKAKYQRSGGVLQPIQILGWKQEDIAMDFIIGLPKTTNGYDVIWVIINKLTKSTYFLPIKVIYSMEQLAQLYIKKIVRLHEVPMTIISARDNQFTSHFWRCVQTTMGTMFRFSTTFHPQIDGQIELTNQTLEDMPQACALDFKGSWCKHLCLAKSAYNNSYQETIRMALYEALYGRKYRSPICWHEARQKKEMESELRQKTDFIDETTKVVAENGLH